MRYAVGRTRNTEGSTRSAGLRTQGSEREHVRLSLSFCIPQVSSCTPKLPGQDSNLDSQDQNLKCYRYTTG